jgi:Porin PorA
MRRVTGLVAVALGTFLIVLAALTRFYIAGQVVKFPLDENTVSTLTASNVSYFSTGLLQEITRVSMTDTSTTQGDVAAGSAHTAVWNNFTYLYDNTNQLTYSYSLRRLPFDRRSGELVNCCGAAIDGKKVHLSGLGYVWPLNAQKQTYQIFDSTLMKPEPANFEGTASVDGLTTYKYVENVTPIQFATQTLPGSLVGMPNQQTVQLGEYYTGTTTEWVDPITGAPVQVAMSQHLYLAGSSGNSVLNLLDGNFTTTPASVAAAVSTAKSYDAKISVISLVIPATGGLAGVIILIIGVILGRQRRGYEYVDEAEQDLAGAPG